MNVGRNIGGYAMRTVTVRYLVPVYATVDLDAEPIPDRMPDGTATHYYADAAVPRVFEGDESIVRLDHAEGIAALTSGDVIDTAYDDGAIEPATLTVAERMRALDIAERTIWPSWDRG
jgi:hypothetical protein